MTDYLFAPPPVNALPIVGSTKQFPINRIYCVGRNYAEHSREMGGDPEKEIPFFFQKNPDSIILDGKFPYPEMDPNVHWELELVFALKSGGRNIKPADALKHVYAYTVGLDMTRRNLQNEAKKLGRPWETGKAFDRSGPIAPLNPVEKIGHPKKAAMWLDVNGEKRQNADIADMIWDVPNIIAFASNYWELKAGDIIFTGTPAGVGACKKGDKMHAHIDGIGDLTCQVV